ncbi:MAG TPA: CPBP family intramembrane metalloprotease, partial [Bacteroidetes bacterium]|nr:CPBP family intramembrane metalloprotease [Bacteroidota bacterium]
SNLKGWTPLIHSALFSLYHIWTPWMFVARTLGVLPLVYIVKRKRNIYLGIIVHCLLNSVDFIVGVHFILNRL